MSPELISIAALAAAFALATVLSVNMGVLSFAAAFLVGRLAAGMSDEDIFAGFPGDLFVVLVGVTFLFAIARANGTTDWLVDRAVRLVGGRIAVIPWVMFAIGALLTSIGAVSPAACAIVAPIALNLAHRCGIRPLLMGVMVVHGTQAGAFSPISVYGTIVNGVVDKNHLPGSPLVLFLGTLLVNTLLAVVVYAALGGLKLRHAGRAQAQHRAGDGEPEPATAATGTATTTTGPANSAPGGAGSGPPGTTGGADTARTTEPAATTGVPSATATAKPADPADPGGSGTQQRGTAHQSPSDAPERLNRDRTLTLLGLAALVVGALGFELDVGLLSLTIAVLLGFVSPDSCRRAPSEVAWPTVLLVCGVLTYVAVLQSMGTIDYAGHAVAGVGVPLLAALLLCYIGAVVSAFASSTALMGALIPLAVPFLKDGTIGAVGTVTAIAVAATVVDVSPFSTNGAIVLANARAAERDAVYRQLLLYGGAVVIVVPLLTWLALIVTPGLL